MVSLKPKHNPRKVLISQSGDWSNAARLAFLAKVLKENWGCQTAILLDEKNRDWAYSLQYDEILYVDTKWYFNKSFFKRAYARFALWITLLVERFDFVLETSEAQPLGLIFKSAFCRNVFGVTSHNSPNKKMGYKYKFFRDENEGGTDFGLRILKMFDIEPRSLNYTLKVKEADQKLTLKRLQVFELPLKNFLIVAPGSGDESPKKFVWKRWPFMVDFLKLFCEKTNLPVLLVGEFVDSGVVLQLTGVAPERIHSWVGQSTREEIIAALGEATAYVGCDTGVSHFAGMVGTPGVVLFGPTSPEISQLPGLGKTLLPIVAQVPCSPCYKVSSQYNWECQDNICMKTISPNDVWAKLSQIARFSK